MSEVCDYDVGGGCEGWELVIVWGRGQLVCAESLNRVIELAIGEEKLWSGVEWIACDG